MRSTLLKTSILSLAFGLNACGPAAYKPQDLNATQGAAGAYSIPAKVDIAFAIDNSSSMKKIYPKIQTEISTFLSKLESSGLDYRAISTFNSTSLYQPRGIAASKYHTNWIPFGQWKKPFGQATEGDDSLTIQNGFTSNTSILIPSDGDLISGGEEYGVRNVISGLANPHTQNNFMRSDSLLAVIVISNGYDNELADIRNYPDGPRKVGVLQSKVQEKVNELSSLKDSNLIQFYAAVSNSTTCKGERSFVGDTYTQMATAFGSNSYNICNSSLTSILEDMTKRLASFTLKLHKRALILPNAPEESSLSVVVYRGGNKANTETIPQSSTNGWSYVGFQNNIALDGYKASNGSEILLNRASGYIIQLNGDYLTGSKSITGSDIPDVRYTAKGAQSAVK